jgi:dihydroorotase
VGSTLAVDLVRTAKHKGTHVTCDATPFHFFFSDTDITDFDPNFKFIPPIGNQEDVQAIKEGLKDGTIDIITSDHIPWTAEEKNVDFDQAPFGSIGLETVFGMSYTALVLPGILTVAELLKKLTSNPAKVLGLPLSRLEVGAEADLCVLDLKASWVVEPKTFQSLASNTPMKGKTLQGKPVATVVKGEIVMKEGKIQENVFPLRG